MMKFSRIAPILAVLLCAAGFAPRAAAAVQTTPLSDNFSSYPLNTCFTEGSAFGQWSSVLSGEGCNQVESSSSAFCLDQSQAPSAAPSDTRSSLTVGPAFSAPETISVDVNTNAQLRQNSPPNPWEVGWVLWDYTDSGHFYYFQPRPNGWELGKEDPAYPGSQRVLATGTSPVYPIGAWYAVKIIQIQNVLTVYVNGQPVTTFTDTETPYTTGNIGLYNEDSDVRFANIAVSVTTSALGAPAAPGAPPATGVPSASDIGANAATINWTTTASGDSQVQYGQTATYASLTMLNPSLTTSHSVVLGSLSAGTLYHYAVMSRDSLGDITISSDSIFTTVFSTPSAIGMAAASGSDQARAPQKFLSPGLADGINDVAVFGPNAEDVTIYSAKGRQVFHGSQQGGAPIVWNCRDGSGRIDESGVYIAKIKTNGSGVLYQSFALVK
jgi:hypothetical protein